MPSQSWMEVMATAQADSTSINTSVTETVISNCAATVFANTFQNARTMHVVAFGRIGSTGTPTIRFRLRLGGLTGTLLWDSGTITQGSTVTAATWSIDIWIQTRSNGATGTLIAMGTAIVGSALAPTVGSATGAPAIGVYGSAGDDTPAAVTADLTADAVLNLTAQHSASSASNLVIGHMFILGNLN